MHTHTGEISVARASKAQQLLLCTDAAGVPSRSVSGMLVCTNYRFCFIPAADSAVQVRVVLGAYKLTSVYERTC